MNHSTVAPRVQTACEMALECWLSGRPLSITAPDEVRRWYWTLRRRAAGEPMDELDLHELVSYVGDRADVRAKLEEV